MNGLYINSLRSFLWRLSLAVILLATVQPGVTAANNEEYGIGEGYDPVSPGDPEAPQEKPQTYTLTLVSNPIGAGSLSFDKMEYQEGNEVYCTAYSNSVFKFKEWVLDGEVVSTNPLFKYTMPARDVVLVANYVFDPNGPGDPSPEEQKVKHPVTLRSSPAGTATFNYSPLLSVEEGENIYLRVYPTYGWELEGWTVNGADQNSNDSDLSLTMGEIALDVVANMKYNPASPGNPGSNYWNPQTGEVVLDDFRPGTFYSTLNTLLDYATSGVSSLIVKGVMDWSDAGYAGICQNATVVDFSRTGGLTELRNYTFTSEALTDILLPSCLTQIGYCAFYDVPNLKSITLYAPVPPTVNYQSFYGIPHTEDCILYVPAEAIPLYAEAEYWKDFMILPITANAYVMQVNLPDDASDGRYKNNTIQIVNVNSGLRQKYVVSDRHIYTFNGLQKDEVYNVYMFSQSGLELGRIENVIIPDHDFEVGFENLKKLHAVAAKVVDTDNRDVTGQVTVEWLKPRADETTVYLRKGASLNEVPEGEELICRVTLDGSLGTRFIQPEEKRFAVSDDNEDCVITLSPFRTLTIGGKVTDTSGAAISGVTVSATQTLNGRFPKTVTVKPDRKGVWEMNVFEAPATVLSYSASECVSVNDTIGQLSVTGTTVDLGTKVLKSIVGARIDYSLTYHAAGVEPRPYIDEDKDLTIAVYNLTQARDHKEVSLQYPVIAVLDENINEGDELRLTLTSRSGAFHPMTATVKVDASGRAATEFDIIGKGGISAHYAMTENPGVNASLYNSKGELVKKQLYEEAMTVITGLDDGDYILVTMGASGLMGSLQRLSALEEVGLREDADYVRKEVKVESGKLTDVSIEEVPLFDESHFYYTTPSSGFTSNKSEVTTGNYLTLRAAVDFKDVYKGAISDISLVVDLPDNSEMVAQSMIQGSTQKPYTIDGHRLTIPLGDQYRDQIRFCVIPTSGGEFAPSAYITFMHGGKSVTQPLGTPAISIKDLAINVPSLTASLSFKATGSAAAKSEVEVISNGAVIGRAVANGNGRWVAECVLPEATKLGSVFIAAKITTPNGLTLTTEEKEIKYDEDAIFPSEVVMTFYNGWAKRQYEVIWNLLESTCSTNKYDFYNTTNLTFLVKFTGDDPSKVRNIVLNVFTSDGTVRKFIPVYSENQNCWIAIGEFSSNSLPTNVSVDYEMTETPRFDSDFLSEYLDLNGLINTLYGEEQAWLESLQSQFENAADEEKEAIIGELLAKCGVEISDIEDDTLTEEIISQRLQEMTEDPDWLGNLLSASPFGADLSEYMQGVSFTRCDGLTAENLVMEGYTAVPKSDGNSSYYKLDNNVFVFVDFENDTRMTVDLNSNSVLARSLREARAGEDDRGWLKDIMELAEKIKTTVQSVYDFFNECNERLGKLILEYTHEIEGLNGDLNWLKKNSNNWFLKGEVEFKLFIKGKALQGLESVRDWLKTNVKEWMQGSSKASKIAGKAFSFSSLILDGVEASKNMTRLYDLRDSILPPCQQAQQCAAGLKEDTRSWIRGSGAYYTYKLGADLAELIGMGSAISALIPSGGTSITVILASAAVVAVNLAADAVYSSKLEAFIDRTKKSVEKMKELCKKKDPKPEDFPKPGDEVGNNSGTDPNHYRQPANPLCDPVNPILDPSGYVYEAVPSNRVEGVQATIYYKETKEDMYGDPYEEIVLWNAEEYAQKNPLFTDEYGMYQWDVPQGLWQVKFEKDGYVTAYSEWLPVPPPQLDVNIGITQNKQPEVIGARAYEEGIEVRFDKYMDPSTLNTGNIYVSADGKKLSGSIRLMGDVPAEDNSVEGDAAMNYASGLRFVPEEPLSGATGEIVLTVRRDVLSYAGIPMTETYTQTLDVEKEVLAIAAEDMEVLLGTERELTIFALPPEAAAGRKVRITASSDLILSVDKSEALFDEEGKATVIVTGLLPGTAMLSLSMDNVDVKGECVVDVVKEFATVEPPRASRASGSAVYRGATVKLIGQMPDDEIYYTLDGSCPCDADGSRILYTEPIVITDDVEIQAMSVRGEIESDVAIFNYMLKRAALDLTLNEGWTWISHPFESPLSAVALMENQGIEEVRSRTQALQRDPALGITGELTALEPGEGYKIRVSGESASLNFSDIARNPAIPVSVTRGWNWIGYPFTTTLTPGEAFGADEVETLDAIVGQYGFAQFDGEKWVGTLEALIPGEGYLYLSGSDKTLTYNAGAIAASGVNRRVHLAARTAEEVNVHRYPEVMAVIATLIDDKGEPVDNSVYDVRAYSGEECRGVGQLAGGLMMVSVYGNPGDKVTFRIANSTDPAIYSETPEIDFSESLLGDLYDPYKIKAYGGSGMEEMRYGGSIGVSVEDKVILVKGIDPAEIESIEVYDVDGRKMMRESHITDTGLSVETLDAGVYVVTVRANGEEVNQKIAIGK